MMDTAAGCNSVLLFVLPLGGVVYNAATVCAGRKSPSYNPDGV